MKSLVDLAVARNGLPPASLVWSKREAVQLRDACAKDALDYWYSGLVSLGEAIHGADQMTFTWATVKAYYASFYLSRSCLCRAAKPVEFVEFAGKKAHFVIECGPGASPRKVTGNTHDAVLKQVEAGRVVPQLSGQPIGGFATSWEWLNRQRNLANYVTTRFGDPKPTSCMRRIAVDGVRRTTQAYVADTTFTYTFDEDHAILAYPISLSRLMAETEVPDFGQAELAHLDFLFRDAAGPLSLVRRLYRRS